MSTARCFSRGSLGKIAKGVLIGQNGEIWIEASLAWRGLARMHGSVQPHRQGSHRVHRAQGQSQAGDEEDHRERRKGNVRGKGKGKGKGKGTGRRG